MHTVLSTKKLNPSQKQRLLNAGLALVDTDFITTKAIPFHVDTTSIENAIFTSQNGIESAFSLPLQIKNCFCVGKRTEKLLQSKSQFVAYAAANAEELGAYITTQKPKEEYHYFCAKDRLDTLPNILNGQSVNWHEIPVYKTIHTPKSYPQQFNGGLFFSPSGVESYFSINTAPIHSFCIGNTTATALKKYTKKYTVASQPTIENVLVKVIKHFNEND